LLVAQDPESKHYLKYQVMSKQVRSCVQYIAQLTLIVMMGLVVVGVEGGGGKRSKWTL